MYASDKPGVARDVIEQIGLSFTDFTEDRSELKEALLNSSIALASLYLDSNYRNEALRAVDVSTAIVRDNQELFMSSQAGQSIAFFAYAVQGNLLEEINSNTFPAKAYEQAFSMTGNNIDATQENLADSYKDLLRSFSDNPQSANLQALARASLKKHYAFKVKKLAQELEEKLAVRDWKEADLLTWKVIYSSASSKDVDRFRYENVSCSDLEGIDNLWLNYSQIDGEPQFGLQIQQEIYRGIEDAASRSFVEAELGRPAIEFSHQLGWHADNQNSGRAGNTSASWLSRFFGVIKPFFVEYDSLIWDTNYFFDTNSRGYLPALAVNEYFRGWLYDVPSSNDGGPPIVTEHCGYIFLSANQLIRAGVER